VRFTIERIRTAVLIAGVLLVAALAIFLTLGRWRSPFNRRDLPKKLGVDIQQEANGFTHAEFHAGHEFLKITASKVEQLKNSRYRLHAAKIEMYGAKGGGADRIEGSEFEYDQDAGVVQAEGPVEITLDRPPAKQSTPGKPAPTNESGPRQIHVKTVGLTFNQNTGVATASNHVEFDLPQASGSARAASFDSQRGELVLTGAVQLAVQRGTDSVAIQAQRAEFDRDASMCVLAAATARFRSGDAQADRAEIQFRDDGSAQQLNAANGFVLTTTMGSRVSAPTASLRFSKANEPTDGHLEGGVVLDSERNGRTLHGTAPTAQLEFSSAGLLRHVHMERNVDFESNQQTNVAGVLSYARRVWKSPVADLAFRSSGTGHVDLDSLHGSGGVVVTSESQRGKAASARARMTADEMSGGFGAGSALTSMTGIGHASLEQTTETGTQQSTSGDRVEAHFTLAHEIPAGAQARSTVSGGSLQIESATVTGNVVFVQQPATQSGSAAPPSLRATAARAEYQQPGEWLHLMGAPHVENGSIQIDADKIDIARASGDAFAHGAVKGTWIGGAIGGPLGGLEAVSVGRAAAGSGARGPTHVVANEALIHQATGEATFRGQARLWQGSNSIAAPTIVLDRSRQTLVARTTSQTDPVRVVLVRPANLRQAGHEDNAVPSVIRVRGGDLKYSDAERKATMRGGVLGNVVAETAEATTRSRELELILSPAGTSPGKDGESAQVDRMTARGDVSIESRGRRGTGQKLDYSSERAEYVLTGTAADPPRMTDPARGSVTGDSLIFNGRDDSVYVEGGQHATTTETTAPKRQ
jgi:lipopolysaccharide export system protein LptA